MNPRASIRIPRVGLRPALVAALVAGLALAVAPVAQAAPHGAKVFSAAGANAAAIQTAVDAFRSELGPSNGGAAGPLPGGRREINWDGVPDSLSAPNLMPADLFNVTIRRGVIFATNGTGFQVSADSDNPTATPVEFGNINPNYPANFTPFSSPRLFTALGSIRTSASFFVPGTTTAAEIKGFGVVFTDVEIAGSTTIEYFDAKGRSLGTFTAPVSGNGGLSFLGVTFAGPERVARVLITSGNAALGAAVNDSSTVDVVVMDDFIFGEPQPLRKGT